MTGIISSFELFFWQNIEFVVSLVHIKYVTHVLLQEKLREMKENWSHITDDCSISLFVDCAHFIGKFWSKIGFLTETLS